MSSILNSNSVVLATAMAVSGTVIVLALRLQKSIPTTTSTHFSINQPIPLSSSAPSRSCISSDGKRREKNKKKRVHFAEDVVDPIGNSEEFRRRTPHRNYKALAPAPAPAPTTATNCGRSNKVRKMPANRMALYNGILRDRVVHRPAFSY